MTRCCARPSALPRFATPRESLHASPAERRRARSVAKCPRRSSETHFLAGRSHVAHFAGPAVRGELERRLVLITEKRARLAAPVATNDVRISDLRVRAQHRRRRLFLARGEVVAAQHFA